jgi:hypothetical protein
MPSTLNLFSCTMTNGLLNDTQSISPFSSSFWKIGRFLMQTDIFNWSAGMCYTTISLSSFTYWSLHWNLLLLLLNKHLEVDIYLNSHLLVICFSFGPGAFHFIHSCSSQLSLPVDLLNLVSTI